MRRAFVLTLLTLAACARPPARLAGEFPRVTVPDAQQGDRVGERVRWGGLIVETKPGRDETCMQIVSLPLDRRARPRLFEDAYGRFEACAPGLYDPEVYEPRREVTVVGTLEPPRAGKIGDYDYVFPRVAAEAIYLWPERPVMVRGYYDYGPYAGPGWYGYPYYYPYYPYGPYWGWWGWGWGGGWHGGGHWHDGGHWRDGGGRDGRGGRGGGGGRGGR